MNRTVLAVGSVVGIALLGILFMALGNDPGKIDSPLIGKAAPGFALKAVGSGETIDLQQLRGRPVVINFWATWCMPCYEEHPTLVANARSLGNDVQFIGVVFNDTEEKIQAFLRERGSAYPTLLDQQGKIAIAYGVGGVPETFFVNRQGTIVAKYSGPINTDALQAHVRKALQ